jgi:hypothetical protein
MKEEDIDQDLEEIDNWQSFRLVLEMCPLLNFAGTQPTLMLFMVFTQYLQDNARITPQLEYGHFHPHSSQVIIYYHLMLYSLIYWQQCQINHEIDK